MTELYLIRHGEAMGAIEHFVGDGGLSPLGIRQAERLRDRLLATREIAADVFIASTLPRAQQTAQIIALAIDAPLQYDDEIQEMRPGEAEGLPYKEFDERYGEPDFDTMPYRPVSPGGENWGQFMLRVGTALDRIIRTYEGKTILLVCHGGVIDATFLYFFRTNAWVPPEARFYTRNTSITHWQQHPTYRKRVRWRLMRYNDALHLYDIGASARIPWGDLLQAPASDDNRPSVPLPSE